MDNDIKPIVLKNIPVTTELPEDMEMKAET